MTAYQRIADSLRRKLLAAHWSPGERLPTERELCKKFDASQITIRRALQILEEENLVERRQGSGTYAKTAARKIPILVTDFFGSIRRHAPRLSRRLLSCHWSEAPENMAEALKLPKNAPVLLAMRIDELQDMPAIVDEVAIPDHYARRLGKDDLAQLDFLTRWQTVEKFRVCHCNQTIEAVKAKRPISRLLQVRSGEPLLQETCLLFAEKDRPAGIVTSYYRHDVFRFDVTFSYHSPNPSHCG